MKTVPLFIGRRKRALRSFSSRLAAAGFIGSAANRTPEPGVLHYWRSVQYEAARSCDGGHRGARLVPLGGFGAAEDALCRRLRRLFREDDPRRGDPGVRKERTASRSNTSPATRPTRWPSCRRRRATSRSTSPSSTTVRCTRRFSLASAARSMACPPISMTRRGSRMIARSRSASSPPAPRTTPRFFRQKGWAPPTSWNDLKDPKYQKQLVIPPINNTYGLHTLLMLARMNGGSETNVDPASRSSRLMFIPMCWPMSLRRAR